VSRLRRFLHIERSRAERPAEAAGPAGGAAGRFGTVERPAPAPAEPPASGAGLGRFRPEPPPPLELAEPAAGGRPFTRCMRCGMDHGLAATECSGCGARLDTEEQRELNERLWASRREEAAREARAAEERRALSARDAAELERARRAMGEELAREVGRRERLRLDGELGPDAAAWGALRRLLSRLLGRRAP
jgi:hypothetical protein